MPAHTRSSDHRIKLTATERKMLDLVDAAGWIGYYLQDAAMVADECDITEAEADRERLYCEAATLTGDLLTIDCESMAFDDIGHHLTMQITGDSLLNASDKRAVGSLLRKMDY